MSEGSVHEALGNLALLFDIIPTIARPKMAPDGPVSPGTPEFDLMLATILFDIVRKRALAQKALRKFLLHADPDLVQRVLSDMADLSDAEELQDYGTLATLTHDKMLQALNEMAAENRATADQLYALYRETVESA